MFAAVPAGAQTEAAKEDKVVCKAKGRDADLGSNIRSRKKTCMRMSDWEELERLNERAKMRIQERNVGAPAPVPGVGPGG